MEYNKNFLLRILKTFFQLETKPYYSNKIDNPCNWKRSWAFKFEFKEKYR